MAIRNNLRVIMAQRKVKSITQLSKKIGYHQATIRNFESGLHKRVDAGLIEAICKELNCDLQDLLYIEK